MMESPGSIRFQVGLSVSKIRDCIANGDLGGMADQIEYLITVASPKLSPDELTELVLPDAPDLRRDKSGKMSQQYFRALNGVQRKVLCYLSERQLYAYKEPESGDGSSLVEDPEKVEEELRALEVR